MTGSIDDVNQGVLVTNGGVFGQDGDTAFSFEVIGIHDAGGYIFPFSKDSRLFEECIDEGGFPVVNVSNDSNVTDRQRHKILK